MYLAVGQQRVDDGAAVVDGHQPLHRHLAGIAVDLDDCDVRAERERRALWFEVELLAQRFVLRAGDLAPSDGLGRRAYDMEVAGVEIEHDVVEVGFELIGGQLARVLHE